ncbi:hypothetical protein Taro_008225 [Colocasia esculenta]|uniref:Uncharacterized protein n=1 Tax=Colocasia esculenta TaxID=4460 RepID=A0A843TXQ5_COLES|nr:hypothetical protein [Colocasia esculenta]
MSDPTKESFVLEVGPGTYLPKNPSSHTSGSRQQIDIVADARCDTDEETFHYKYLKWELAGMG